MKRTLTSTLEVERGGIGYAVTITGTYYPGCRGRKAHPMDRFAEPDDEPAIEDVSAFGPNGEVSLTEPEYQQATEKLWEAGRRMTQIAAKRRNSALFGTNRNAHEMSNLTLDSQPGFRYKKASAAAASNSLSAL